MPTFRKNIKVVLLFAGIAAVISLAVLLTNPGYAQVNNESESSVIRPIPRLSTRSSWLSQYEGKTVKVTFVTAPSHLGLQKTSALEIVEASDAGFVVTFRPSRTVFFPYSQIISIEPYYRSN